MRFPTAARAENASEEIGRIQWEQPEVVGGKFRPSKLILLFALRHLRNISPLGFRNGFCE